MGRLGEFIAFGIYILRLTISSLGFQGRGCRLFALLPLGVLKIRVLAAGVSEVTTGRGCCACS